MMQSSGFSEATQQSITWLLTWNLNIPQVRKVWQQVQRDLKSVNLFRDAIHTTIIQVGKHAVRQPKAAYPSDAPEKPARFTADDLQVAPILNLPEEIPLRYRATNLDLVVTWWNQVSQSGTTEQVVSWFQLVALFEHMTQNRGVW